MLPAPECLAVATASAAHIDILKAMVRLIRFAKHRLSSVIVLPNGHVLPVSYRRTVVFALTLSSERPLCCVPSSSLTTSMSFVDSEEYIGVVDGKGVKFCPDGGPDPDDEIALPYAQIDIHWQSHT